MQEIEPIRIVVTVFNDQSETFIQTPGTIKAHDGRGMVKSDMPKRQNTSPKPEAKKRCSEMDVENILQTAAQMADVPTQVKPEIQTFSVALGGDRYVTLTEWNGTKRVDIRRWQDGTKPTKDGASLLLKEWKILCSHADEIEYQMLRAKEEHVNWTRYLGRGFSLWVFKPYLEITKYCIPEGGQHFRHVGIDLDRNQWNELRKAMPLIEEQEPEIRDLIPLYRTDL